MDNFINPIDIMVVVTAYGWLLAASTVVGIEQVKPGYRLFVFVIIASKTEQPIK